MQREDVAGSGGCLVRSRDAPRPHCRGHAVEADQLVQRGQRGGQLRAGDDFGAIDRDEGVRAARVRAVVEAHALGQAQRVHVHLPAGGAVHLAGPTEDLSKRSQASSHLPRRSTPRRPLPTPSCQRTWSQVWMPTSKPASRTLRMMAAQRLPMSGPGSSVPYSSVLRP